MLQLCVFGGYEGPLSAGKRCYFTLFGGCTLTRPTLARQLITARRAGRGPSPAPQSIFITIFGGSCVKCPTLADEFVDLREAVNNGSLDLASWDTYMAELDRWHSAAIASLTLFGGFEESELPSEDEEIEGIALQRHFRTLGEESGRILEMGVGQGGSSRRTVIQQAVLAS